MWQRRIRRLGRRLPASERSIEWLASGISESSLPRPKAFSASRSDLVLRPQMSLFSVGECRWTVTPCLNVKFPHNFRYVVQDGLRIVLASLRDKESQTLLRTFRAATTEARPHPFPPIQDTYSSHIQSAHRPRLNPRVDTI